MKFGQKVQRLQKNDESRCKSSASSVIITWLCAFEKIFISSVMYSLGPFN